MEQNYFYVRLHPARFALPYRPRLRSWCVPQPIRLTQGRAQRAQSALGSLRPPGGGSPTKRPVGDLLVQAQRRFAKWVLLHALISDEDPPCPTFAKSDKQLRSVSAKVEDQFGFAEMQVVSFADLYAGKIVAALDRQHPRDLFDVRDLLANEGISDDLRQAFIVYLISHGRPISEVVVPRRKDIRKEYEQGFEGMTLEPVTLDELLKAREDLITEVSGKMPDAHREFLVGFKRGKPHWPLLGMDGVAELPAVRWKQTNLDKLPAAARKKLVDQLITVLK